MPSAAPGVRFGLRAAMPRVLVVLLFATAMAYVEAAAVLYLRTLYGGVDPLHRSRPPLTPVPDLLGIEVGREAATIVMLATVGWLAGRGPTGRLGGFLAAFGAWDIGYYVFLWVFAGWPASPMAGDILFLLPLPWWGPVLAPALIAAVLVATGGLLLAREAGDGGPGRPGRQVWLLVLGGGGLCLIAFTADALLALPRGLNAAFAVHGVDAFPWPLYLAGLLCGSVGLGLAVTRHGDPA